MPDIWYRPSLCLWSIKSGRFFGGRRKLKINARSLAKALIESGCDNRFFCQNKSQELICKSFARLFTTEIVSFVSNRKSFSSCQRESRVDGSTTASVTQPVARLRAFLVWQSVQVHVSYSECLPLAGLILKKLLHTGNSLKVPASYSPALCLTFKFRWMWFLKPAFAKKKGIKGRFCQLD